MLAIIQSIFWNPTEHRLRAAWRILIHAVLFLVFYSIAQFIGIRLRSLLGGPLGVFANEALIVLGVLAALWVAGRLLDRRPFASFGFHLNRQWWLDLGFGLSLGGLLMALIFLVERSLGWVVVTGTLQSGQAPFWSAILTPVFLFIQVGIVEESLSRGYHLRNVAEGLNGRGVSSKLALLGGYLVSSLVFGMLHLSNPNASWISTANIAVAGLLMGLGVIWTGSLAIPIGLHITWNFFQGNVFGFPVSGMQIGPTFIAIQQGGPELWTGGAFGPEAGLIGLLAMLLGGLLTWGWVRQQHGETRLKTELAEYGRPQLVKEDLQLLPRS